MPKDRDAASKDLIEARPADWLTLSRLPVPLDPAAITVVDAELSTVTTAADKLIRVDRPEGPYLAHIEVQSSSDPELDRRIAAYNALARRRHRLPVFSAVFLLTKASGRGVTGRVSERLASDLRLAFAYRRIRVWELPAESVLGGPLGTLPLAPLTAVRRADLPAVVDRLAHRFDAEASQDDARRLWMATQILFGLRFEPHIVEVLMQGVLDMRESSVWQKIHGDGRVEGRVEGRAAQLIELGTAKFGTVPSPAVASRIVVIADEEALRQLGRRLLTATTWDELMVGA